MRETGFLIRFAGKRTAKEDFSSESQENHEKSRKPIGKIGLLSRFRGSGSEIQDFSSSFLEISLAMTVFALVFPESHQQWRISRRFSGNLISDGGFRVSFPRRASEVEVCHCFLQTLMRKSDS
jgi:hypothetical protein